jgi:hypothetical protein
MVTINRHDATFRNFQSLPAPLQEHVFNPCKQLNETEVTTSRRLTGHDVYKGPAVAASNKMNADFKISTSFWGVRDASCSLHVNYCIWLSACSSEINSSHIQNIQITNMCSSIFIMYSIHSFLTNMFRPAFWPFSG